MNENIQNEVVKKPLYKKWWFWVVAAVIIIALISAIGGKDENPENKSDISSANQTSDNNDSENDSMPEEAGNGTLGDYTVSIVDHTLTQDYEGKPAVVITYNWTNNSDDTTSFAVALNSKVFQNDIQCDIAVIMDSNVYNADNYMKDIRPGASLDVQLAYVLQDNTNPIEVEVSELISFSDDKILKKFDIA